MANFNRIILCGNLTRDPQMKYLPNQTPLVEFGLAVSKKFKVNGEDREEVLFVECTLFGKGAEVINQYCQKGKQLLVEGRLKYDTWEDKQGGGKRSKHSVVVDNFQLMGGRDSGGGGGGGYSSAGDEGGGEQRPQQRAPQQQRPAPAQPQRPAPEQPFANEPQFKEDDIPF